MYKTRLQELCHRRSWELPQYSTTRMGLDHGPLFLTTVTVNGESFVTPAPARSSKLSQNDAAQIAFDHLSAPPRDFPPADPVVAESGSSEIDQFNRFLSDLEKVQPSLQDEGMILEEDGASQLVEDSVVEEIADVEHFYKNQLQIFAQRRNLALPVYTCEREGPVHASRFRCKVEMGGKTYDSIEYFRSAKEAEHAAAKVALSSLAESNVKEGGFVMYKNLLQEFCQKQGESFTKQRGPTKKMAEMNAAKFAYTILKERKANQSPIPLHSNLRGQSSYFSNFAPQSVCNIGDVISETAGGLATGHLSKKALVHPETASSKKSPQDFHESIEVTKSSDLCMSTEDDAAMKEMQHVYKNQLQVLAQRRNLALPVYTCEREGNRFRCKVVIDGKAYETLETFQSVKQAEHAAAKLALVSMAANDFKETEVQGDSIMYKNLLQEFTQKRGYALPKYATEVSGGTLTRRTFISTVEVNGQSFTGLGGQTKKLAEMNAAKIAYTSLKERTPSSSVNQDKLINIPKDSVVEEARILRTSPYRPKQETDMVEAQSNSHTVASGGVDTIPWKSQNQHERFGDPFPSSSSENTSPSTSLSSWTRDSSTPVPCDLTGMPPNVIRIYPRSMNTKFPESNVVLSDENWVALGSVPTNGSL
ncbi:hypothetical protein MLD38_015874 [Melastoma candidum]|uniref:Uncharacterized protein n=1 Tax=Melastoma candidum TaxID=119954 RepID=A0ACB9RHP3_9MYRT|nr:hypothetical protein MLD38_015874 [Melastoma candidum]